MRQPPNCTLISSLEPVNRKRVLRIMQANSLVPMHHQIGQGRIPAEAGRYQT